MKAQKLIREQLDKKISRCTGADETLIPPNGWIYSIRKALNMSLRQLGKRLGITPQSVKEIEERERMGTISLKVLRQVAKALDMKLVYVFLPNESSLEQMIEKRAREVAREIVNRTSVSMHLENQGLSDREIEKAIKEKAQELKNEIPPYLWD